jgi:hypothetical protein
MKKVILMLVAISVAFGATAQYKKDKKNEKREEKRKRIDALIKQEEEGVIAYYKHFAGGLKLTTDGLGVFAEIGRSKSIKKAMLYQLEIGERKHNKEEKSSSFGGFSIPYIYGKVNYFYPVKIGVQQQILLGNKSNKNGLSITGNFGGGLSLALLRPYVLEVDKAGVRTKVRYDSPDSSLFVNSYTIGAIGPSLGDGWKNLKVNPGLYIKPAVRFDYGRLNEVLSAVEVGILAEVYAKKVNQMLYNKKQQAFFSAYVALVFGRRR